jgi:hypothetical protein
MRQGITPITGTKMMQTNHAALATPLCSLRRKLSMTTQIAMKLHKTSEADISIIQKTLSNG